GSGFEPGTGWPVFKDLKRLGVKQYSFAKIKKIASGKLTIEIAEKDDRPASESEIPCDTIVMAVGAKPNNVLYHTLEKLGVNVYNLGDSNRVGKVLDAIRDADELVTQLAYSNLE
ncbi:MAG: hypothetical protein ACRDBM_16860, partial [Sporomusa sp.]